MLFKSQIAYIFYKIFDKYKFKEIPFNDFYKKINEYNFTEKIESELIEKNITMEKPKISFVRNFINTPHIFLFAKTDTPPSQQSICFLFICMACQADKTILIHCLLIITE